MDFHQFVALAPAGEAHWPAMERALDVAAINTPLRQAHFLAQLLHESAGFRVLEENLNYSAAGLMKTWPSRFDAATAQAYQRQPQRIANRAYADRNGNGPEASGDGWRYRGRGLIQLTGRTNYRKAGQDLGIALVEQPELAADPKHAALIAAWFWQSAKLNPLADTDQLEAITRRINGGLNGLDDRRKYLTQCKRVLRA